MKRCLSALLCLVLLGALAGSALAEAEPLEPVTVENYDRTLTFDTVPERIVSLSYSETEILAALGLTDKIVGIGEAENVVEECLPEYQDEIAALNIIGASEDGGVPSFEVLLSVEPDFVYATSYSLNPTYGVASLEDFESNGIDVYVATSTYKSGCTIEDTYQDIRNIAAIFRVEERGEEIVAEMQAKVDAVAEVVSQVEEPVTVLNITYCDETQAYSSGGTSLANALIEAAGGVNVLASEERSSLSMSWESVIETNPDYIVVADNSGGVGSSSAEEKIEFLKSMPELQDLDAVKNDRFIPISHFTMSFGCVQNADAVQLLAEGLYPELFS